MKDRREERLSKKLMISFRENGFDGLGLTLNISKCGMCIFSETNLPGHQEISLSIAVPGEIFNMKGEVMWCAASDSVEDTLPEHIGIKILEAPSDYINFVEFLRHQRITPGQPEF